MNYDMDYEIYQYISQQVENYVLLDDLLVRNHLTYHAAKQKTALFKEKYNFLLEKYHIRKQNPVMLCYDLIKLLNQFPENEELQYLYFCTVTDTGLLNEINSDSITEEQAIRNYINQKKQVQELTEFMQIQTEYKQKLSQIKKNIKKSDSTETPDCMQEFQLLYELTVQHTFLYGANKNQIYKDNLYALLICLNNSKILLPLKPYLIFAVLSRKHGMMQNRENFIPNLKIVFEYQKYQIDTDNGKNFNLYLSYLELYDHLKRFYMQDQKTDIAFCDFCFANSSPLSEWFFRYCQPDADIPMNLKQKITVLKSLCFPMLYCYEDYSHCDVIQFESEHPEIWKRWKEYARPAITENFLQAVSCNSDLSEILNKFPYYEKFSSYAELFLYESAERMLDEKMLNLAEKLIK